MEQKIQLSHILGEQEDTSLQIILKLKAGWGGGGIQIWEECPTRRRRKGRKGGLCCNLKDKMKLTYKVEIQVKSQRLLENSKAV